MTGEVIHTILGFLFPTRCIGCGGRGAALCEACAVPISHIHRSCFFCGIAGAKSVCEPCRTRYSLEEIFWPFSYENKLVKELVARFKYRKKKILASQMAKCISHELRKIDSAPFLAIPIPLHPARERERGFNQARLIAEHLALPIEKQALIRVKPTPQLARSSSRRERFKSMAGAFRVTRPDRVRGKNILLIDDVATSGATLAQAARTLKESGAASISAAVFAHG